MNNQQVDHVLTFYRINFDFHDPYKFLLDGNFIKLILEKQVDFKKRLENAITGKIKFYVPSCLIRELQLLGNDFKLVLQKAKQYKKLSCKHGLEVSVDRCIVEHLIGAQNPQKYIVCTQDIELRRQLRSVLNCPLMYFGPDQRIKLQDVHKKNLAIVQKQSKQKLMPKENQLGQITEYKKEKQRKEKQEKRKQQLKIASQMGVKIKTKIAKGPNPMSIRKRKLRPHEMAQMRLKKQNKVHGNNQVSEQKESKGHEQNQEEVNQQVEVRNQPDENKVKRIRKKKKHYQNNHNLVRQQNSAQ